MSYFDGPWSSQKTTIYKVENGHINWIASTNGDLVGIPEDQERELTLAKAISLIPDMIQVLKDAIEDHAMYFHRYNVDWVNKANEVLKVLDE